MRFRISNPIVVVLLVLLSGCYLSHEKGRSTEDDDPSPSVNGRSPSVVDNIPTAVGGGSTAMGGNPSTDVGKPVVDSGIEEASLLGVWQGRLRFEYKIDNVDMTDNLAAMDGIGIEFTDTEMFFSYGDMGLYGFSYSINRNSDPHQLDFRLKSVYDDLTSISEIVDFESTNLLSFSSTFRIENGELTITVPALPSEVFPTPMTRFGPVEIEVTVIFELTRV